MRRGSANQPAGSHNPRADVPPQPVEHQPVVFFDQGWVASAAERVVGVREPGELDGLAEAFEGNEILLALLNGTPQICLTVYQQHGCLDVGGVGDGRMSEVLVPRFVVHAAPVEVSQDRPQV